MADDGAGDGQQGATAASVAFSSGRMGLRQAPPNLRAPRPHRESGKMPRRVCYFCLILPLFFAFCLSSMSVITLAIKNQEVKGKCEPIPCLLSSDSTRHPQVNCWIAFGGGGMVSVTAVLFMLSLVVRMCYGAKVNLCCTMLEVLVLLAVLGVATLVGGILAFGVEGSLVSLREAIAQCNNEDVREKDVIDFMRQSEISAWLSWAFVSLAVIMWVVMAVGFGIAQRPRGRGRHRQAGNETDSLIND